MNQWKVRRSDYVLQSRWLTLRSDSCEIPQGGIVDPYYVLEYPDWVQVTAFNSEDDILITRQYRHAVGQVCVEIPCGEIEKNETPLEAAKRELLEETGYTSGNFISLGSPHPNPARQNNRVYGFMACDCSKTDEPLLDQTECIESLLISVTEILDLIDTNRFSSALHISCLLLALRKRGFLS